MKNTVSSHVYGEDEPPSAQPMVTIDEAGAAAEPLTATQRYFSDEWPSKPAKLGRVTLRTVVSWIVEWCLVLTPAAFLGLGVAILAVNGEPTDTNLLGPKLEAAAKLGPTIFPLLYAAVATRSLRILSRYLCQDGVSLGTVELLLGSRSVFGTIESQLLFRRVSAVGVLLLLLWSLSPIGGQASLRALERADSVTRTPTTLRYMYTGPYSTFFRSDWSRTLQPSSGYLPTVTAPHDVRVAPRDNWGNVRVPQLRRLPPPAAGADDWRPVPLAMKVPEQYSSLVGVPVIGLPPAAVVAGDSSTGAGGPPTTANVTADFTLETSYMLLDCQPWEVFPEESRADIARYTPTFWTNAHPLRVPNAQGTATSPLNITFFLDAADMQFVTKLSDAYSPRSNSSGGRITFGSRHRRRRDPTSTPDVSHTNMISATSCKITEEHVEVAVHCATAAGTARPYCRATKVRPSRVDRRPAERTPLEFRPRLQYIVNTLPLAFVASRAHESSVTELFLYNSTASFVLRSAAAASPDNAAEPAASEDPVRLADVPPAVFADRLQLLLNTWYQLSLIGDPAVYFGDNPAPPANADGSSGNLTAVYGFDFARTPPNGSLPADTMDSSCRLLCTRATPSTTTAADSAGGPVGEPAMLTHTVRVFAYNRAWLALLFASAGVLLATGVAGSVLGCCTHVPDMLGYVASMTYNNRYFALPGEGVDNSGGGGSDGRRAGEDAERREETDGGGGVLDAMERARLLRNVVVSVADVRGSDVVGRIAFTSGADVRRLEKGRLYT